MVKTVALMVQNCLWQISITYKWIMISIFIKPNSKSWVISEIKSARKLSKVPIRFCDVVKIKPKKIKVGFCNYYFWRPLLTDKVNFFQERWYNYFLNFKKHEQKIIKFNNFDFHIISTIQEWRHPWHSVTHKH